LIEAVSHTEGGYILSILAAINEFLSSLRHRNTAQKAKSNHRRCFHDSPLFSLGLIINQAFFLKDALAYEN
jgi:hypothetical protein